MDTLQTREVASLSDEKFAALLDVDFVEHARKFRRLMGATPRLESVGMAGAPLYADVMPLVEESQWKPLIEAKNAGGGMLQPFVREVKDQDGEPSCVSTRLATRTGATPTPRAPPRGIRLTPPHTVDTLRAAL